MSEENSLGKRIKKARMRLHWTQKRLADELQVSRTTVNRWEKDAQHPTAYYRKKLVDLLGLDEKEEDAPSRAASQAPQDIENLPSEIDNLPFKQNPFFTGREAELEQLRRQLQETGTAAITQPISISGLGGIGKTELALEFAHRSYPNVYRAVFWVNAADKDMLQASYDKLAEMLKLPERNEQVQDRRIEAVKRWLKSHTNWLLIMDNADDLPLAESFLPAKHFGHILFTTRSQSIGTTTKRARRIEVVEMEPEEGLLLLLRRSHVLEDDTNLDMVAADIREPALQLVELLGGLPLAIDQAGAYVEETGVSFADYVHLYHEQRRRLLNKRVSLESEHSELPEYIKHPESVAATIELSLKKASERHPMARDILHLCVCLPDGMPEEVFYQDEAFKHDIASFYEGIAALQRYSLIKHNRQETTLYMHPLVQAVLLDAMSPDLIGQSHHRVYGAMIICEMIWDATIREVADELNTREAAARAMNDAPSA